MRHEILATTGGSERKARITSAAEQRGHLQARAPRPLHDAHPVLSLLLRPAPRGPDLVRQHLSGWAPVHFNPGIFIEVENTPLVARHWHDTFAWAGILLVTAYAMGTLYERHESKQGELRETYHGVLLILRQFVSKDSYTESHCYRVSVYAAKIASYLRSSADRIDDVRAASLLHDTRHRRHRCV